MISRQTALLFPGLLLCLHGMPAIAGGASVDGFETDWSATCALKGKLFGLRFTSRGGAFGEDDMDVRFKTTAGKSVALAVPRAWYYPRSSVSNAGDLCRGEGPGRSRATAFTVNGNAVLLFLSVDRRPWLQDLMLVLVDVSTGRVMDLKDSRLTIKAAGTGERFTVRRAKEGWQVRLVTVVLQDTGDDSIETFIEGWVTVTVVDGKIRVTKPG